MGIGRPRGIKRYRKDFTLSTTAINMLEEMRNVQKNKSRAVENAVLLAYNRWKKRGLDI